LRLDSPFSFLFYPPLSALVLIFLLRKFVVIIVVVVCLCLLLVFFVLVRDGTNSSASARGTPAA
jgi:hypothetical protein